MSHEALGHNQALKCSVELNFAFENSPEKRITAQSELHGSGQIRGAWAWSPHEAHPDYICSLAGFGRVRLAVGRISIHGPPGVDRGLCLADRYRVTVLGVWLGRELTPQRRAADFTLNEAALRSLGITKREYAVLEQLATGQSNKQIADALHVSPNTVKTHIAKLYDKLEVGQRVQAVQKAKDLRLIP